MDKAALLDLLSEYDFKYNKLLVDLTKREVLIYQDFVNNENITYTNEINDICFEGDFVEYFIIAGSNINEEYKNIIEFFNTIKHIAIKMLFIDVKDVEQEIITKLNKNGIHTMVNYSKQEINETIRLFMNVFDNPGLIRVDHVDLNAILYEINKKMINESNLNHMDCIKTILSKTDIINYKTIILFIEHNKNIGLKEIDEIVKQIEKENKKINILLVSNIITNPECNITIYY